MNPTGKGGFGEHSASINRAGRPPKEHTLTDALKGVIDKQRLGEILWAKAESGDVGAIKYIYDRVDGQPRQSVDMNAEVVSILADFWQDIEAESSTTEDTEGVPPG